MDAELEFLRAQIALAKRNLKLHATGLADDALAPLQVRAFVRRHPWWCLGGALLAGVLTGRRLRRRRPAKDRGPTTAARTFATTWGRRLRSLSRSVFATLLAAGLRAARSAAERTRDDHERPPSPTIPRPEPHSHRSPADHSPQPQT